MKSKADWSTSSLGDRVRYLAEARDLSLNELGRQCGLGSGAMSRLSRDEGAVARYPKTLQHLVDGTGCRLDWLAFGRGSPFEAAPMPGVYPNRDEAARIALDGGIDAEAIEAVLARDPDLERDPTILWWLHEIERTSLVLRRPDAPPSSGERTYAPATGSSIRPLRVAEPSDVRKK